MIQDTHYKTRNATLNDDFKQTNSGTNTDTVCFNTEDV